MHVRVVARRVQPPRGVHAHATGSVLRPESRGSPRRRAWGMYGQRGGAEDRACSAATSRRAAAALAHTSITWCTYKPSVVGHSMQPRQYNVKRSNVRHAKDRHYGVWFVCSLHCTLNIHVKRSTVVPVVWCSGVSVMQAAGAPRQPQWAAVDEVQRLGEE